MVGLTSTYVVGPGLWPGRCKRERRNDLNQRRTNGHPSQATNKPQTDTLIRMPRWVAVVLAILGTTSSATGLGPGPVLCDIVNSCGAGATCCARPSSIAGDWGCCAAPNATCCPDMRTCCPQDFPVCGNGTCERAPGESAPHSAFAAKSPLGRAPPPPPPPPLYPFECTTTKIGCFAETPTGDGWPVIQRTVPRCSVICMLNTLVLLNMRAPQYTL